MSQLTKKAILEATIALAQARPLNKITVRDIVEECGITRNTFYYHFHDIYEVVECAVEERFALLWELRQSDPEAALLSLFEFCVIYKKMWLNLYRAVGYEHFTSYFSKQLHGIVSDHLREECRDPAVSEKDLELLALFCEEAVIGIFLRWLKTDAPAPDTEALSRIVSRFRAIFDGHIALALENCRRLSEPKP